MAKKDSQKGGLLKVPTGIRGLDEITLGGLPEGRPTLVVGNAGAGKTVLAMEFVARGAADYGEPGVFVCFEETPKDLLVNFAARAFDIRRLEAEKKLAFEYIYIERSEIEETGEYDLEGLFIRLGQAIDSIGAKRVALDTIEVLFSGLSNEALLRAELRRLFRWLKEKGVTAVITGERGDGKLSRYGLEEYVADCVLVLDHRMVDQVATRRLRILKYRGTSHGTNEYPFLIGAEGITMMPITSLGLEHEASAERVSTGLPALDEMLGGLGFYRGTSVLCSGSAGTGKTSIASAFVDAACRRGEKCLFFAFEESPRQILRNMRSIGCDLEQWMKSGGLVFHAGRPMQLGLEAHLLLMIEAMNETQPSILVVDPISNMLSAGDLAQAEAMLIRLIDLAKKRGITTLCTSLTGTAESEARETGISSLIDTWLTVRNLEKDGERTRVLFILKSRGMAHSNRVREFVLSGEGVSLVDVYLGPGGMFTGASRKLQMARDRTAVLAQRQEKEYRLAEFEKKRALLEAKISAMQAEFEAESESLKRALLKEDALAIAQARSLEELESEGRAAALAGAPSKNGGRRGGRR